MPTSNPSCGHKNIVRILADKDGDMVDLKALVESTSYTNEQYDTEIAAPSFEGDQTSEGFNVKLSFGKCNNNGDFPGHTKDASIVADHQD